MQDLTSIQCKTISGGVNPAHILIAGAGLMGGYIASEAMSYLGPLSTVVGTVGTSVTCGVICTPIFTVVGTIVCGTAGAVGGYVFSAHIANFAAFGGGAVATGFAVANMIL